MMQYVEFPSGSNTLRGMLHRPEGDGPFPAVLFLHGITANRIESHYLFVKIARALEREGIASLRFDFAGNGESDGEFIDVTASGELADAEAALKFLKRQEGVDLSRLAVLGLSLGGCLAAMLAGKRPEDFVAAVLLSAVAEPARLLSYLRTGKLESQLAHLGYMDWGGHKISRRFLQDLESVHGAEAVAKFPRPVLSIHGTEDDMVPSADNDLYQESRAKLSLPTQYESIAGAGHTFANIEHEQHVLEMTVKFLIAMLRKS